MRPVPGGIHQAPGARHGPIACDRRDSANAALHVDLAEEVSDKIDLYRVKEITPSARRMGEVLAKAGKEVEAAVADLEGFKDLAPRRLAIHSLENEGDRITREALAQLFTDGASPTDLVKWKDLYDLLETTMDQCEHVANVLEATSIKNA